MQNTTDRLQKLCLWMAGAAALVLVGGLVLRQAMIWHPAAVVCSLGLAIGLGALPALRTYQFTAWIVAAVVVGMVYPSLLSWLDSGDSTRPQNKWIMLLVIQAVMFGMGTQMGLKDFAGVAKMPWGVLVGVFCQFSIMPLIGYSLTKLFDFPPEIAAGVVLIGSCSSGLASNVMAYLARANLALSITLTSVATLLAPLMTPLWMKWLAGTYVEVKFFSMMLQIVKIVIVPIGAALLHDYLKHASPRGRWIALGAACVGGAWLGFLLAGGWNLVTEAFLPEAVVWIGITGFAFGAALAGVMYHGLVRWLPWLERLMPVLSMFGIIYYTAVTTAVGREDLLKVGGLLFLAAMIHNTLGYLLGYWLSRGLGMDRTSARTVALEVGLQNGGMATGLASEMGKLGTVGLAAAIFSPWMNVSGSILANYWRRRPVDGEETVPASSG